MWESRGQRRYFYRHVRVGGRPRRLYAGTGQAAELAATADALRRLNREVEARERLAEPVRQREAEAPLLRLCDVTDVLARAALLAADYHRHARGSWRRRRGRDDHCGTGGPADDR